MSKSIKVSDQVYERLLSRQQARESFSQQIETLLNVADLMDKALPLIRNTRDELERRLGHADQAVKVN